MYKILIFIQLFLSFSSILFLVRHSVFAERFVQNFMYLNTFSVDMIVMLIPNFSYFLLFAFLILNSMDWCIPCQPRLTLPVVNSDECIQNDQLLYLMKRLIQPAALPPLDLACIYFWFTTYKGIVLFCNVITWLRCLLEPRQFCRS